MYHRYVALIIFACTFATLSPLWTYAQNLPPVVISEIQWGGSSLSTADEWIELANTSSETLDLGGWTLTGVASEDALITLPAETLFEPHTTYLIANYETGDAKSVLAVHPQLVSTAVSIPNTDLAIHLVNASGEVVDSYEDTGAPDLGSSSPHVSIERDLASGAWFASTDSLNILSSETLGTPGAAMFTDSEEPAIETPALIEEVVEELLPESIISESSAPSDEPIETEEESISSEMPSEEPDLSPPEEETETLAPSESETPPSEESVSETEIVPEPSEISPDTDEEVITLIVPIVSEVVTAAVQEAVALEDPLPEEAPETVTIRIDYSPLRLTEFLSSPADGNEWVELWNSGDETLSLADVTITDASGKITLLSGTIAPDTYLLVENPSGKLNNTEDTITLTLPDGQVLTILTYGTDAFPAPKKGASAGVCSDGWHVDLVPSPAAQNLCPTISLEFSSYEPTISDTTPYDIDDSASGDSPATQGDLPREESTNSQASSLATITTSLIGEAATSPEPEASPEENSSDAKKPAKSSSSKSDVLSVALDELDVLPSGQHVEVTGVIAAAPGAFGKRVAYLNGVQLYFHAADWPELTPGTAVRVSGVWDLDADSRRIKISQALDIAVLGIEVLEPLPFEEASEHGAGDILATASGTLTKKDGETFVFSFEHGGEFRVHDVGKTGSLASLRAGDIVTIIGMLFAENGVWVLAPRTEDDVTLSSATVIAPVTTGQTGTTAASTSTSVKNPAPLIGGGILASSVSALGYWFVRSRKLSFLFSS